MVMDQSQFTRARCPSTGAVAALPREALELGHIPGWVAVDGPLPEGPKAPAFPEMYEPKPVEEAPPAPVETKSAGSASAKKKE
jgi:hypothetical protein